MDNTKDNIIRFRLTAEQKEQIKDYCRKHNITVSEFVRNACETIFAVGGNNNDVDR